MREATLIAHKIQLNFLILIVLDFLNLVILLADPLTDDSGDGDSDEG